MQEEQTQTHETVFRTHSWYEGHTDALYCDLLKLRSVQNQVSNIILPEYVELSCQQLYVQATTPVVKPLTRFDRKIWGKGQERTYTLIMACLSCGMYVHQQGCVLRQFSMDNVLICKSGYKVVAFYQEVSQNTLTVNCPAEYCTDKFYNYSVYSDPEVIENLVNYRKYLAFPAALRLRQKIPFSINCDIFSLGEFVYRLVAAEEIPSPFKCAVEEDIVQHQQTVAQRLCQLRYPDGFVRLVLKALYLLPGDYYFNLMEVQADLQAVAGGRAARQGLAYPLYRQLVGRQWEVNTTTVRIAIDHLTGCIQYQQLQKMNLGVHLYRNDAVYAPDQYAGLAAAHRDKLARFAAAHGRGDLDRLFAAERQGRLVILQGLFGSGKTQALLDVLNFMAGQFSSFVCYVPARGPGPCAAGLRYGAPPPMLGDYCARDRVADFYHYLATYLLFCVQQLDVPEVTGRVREAFRAQPDINKLYSVNKEFFRYVQIGQNDRTLQLTQDVTKDVLLKVVGCLHSLFLMVVLAVDDLQSHFHRAEVNILLDLVQTYPRLSVMVSEVPGVPCTASTFCQGGVCGGQLVERVVETFRRYQPSEDEARDLSKPSQSGTANRRATANIYSDIMSVGSCTSDAASRTSEKRQQNQQAEIRVRSYIYSQSIRRKISYSLQSANYLTQSSMEELLKTYGITQPDFVFTFYRKSSGSIKLVRQMLWQMFQHSAWLQADAMIYNTVELVQPDELHVVAQFLRARQLDMIGGRELEVMHLASLFGYFVDMEWLFQMLPNQKREQIQSLCTQISTQHGYVFSFALQNVQLKHKRYVSPLQNQFITDNIFMWQSTLLCRLLQESFTETFSNNLFSVNKFLLDRYRAQFSFIEKVEDRVQLYLPSFDSEAKLSQFLDNLAEDINQEQGSVVLTQQSFHRNSSLLKLLTRKTPSRLISAQKPFVQHNLTTDNFATQSDGLFVSIDLLLKCLNPVHKMLPDLFDQLELMQLNVCLLSNVRFIGQVPKVYFVNLDYAILQYNECMTQLGGMRIEQLVPCCSGAALSALDSVMQRAEDKVSGLQHITSCQQLYASLEQLNRKFVYYRVQQLRSTRFAQLNTLLGLRYANQAEQLNVLCRVARQLILDGQIVPSCQLLGKMLTQLEAGHLTVANDTEQVTWYFYSTMRRLKDSWKSLRYYNMSILEPPFQRELCIHHMIYLQALIAIIQNDRLLAVNYCLGLLARVAQNKIITHHSIKALYYVFRNYKDLSVSHSSALKCTDTMRRINRQIDSNALAVSSSTSLVLYMFYYMTYFSIKEPGTFEQNDFINKTTNLLLKISSFDLSVDLIILIPWFICYLLDNKQYKIVALLSQSLLKDISYINFNQLNNILLAAAAGSMKMIDPSNPSLEQSTQIDVAQNLFDVYQIYIQVKTFCESDHVQLYRLAYMYDYKLHNSLINQQFQRLILKLKLGYASSSNRRELKKMTFNWTFGETEQVKELYQAYRQGSGLE